MFWNESKPWESLSTRERWWVNFSLYVSHSRHMFVTVLSKKQIKGILMRKMFSGFFFPISDFKGKCTRFMWMFNTDGKYPQLKQYSSVGVQIFFFFASAVLWHIGCSWWQRRTTGYFFHFIFLFCFYIVSTFGLSKYHPYDRESQDPI